MLEKISQAAERAAAGVSRREFLGRFGSRAAAVAAAMGGLLAIPRSSSAEQSSRCPPGEHPSPCPNGRKMCCPHGTRCYCDHFYGCDCIPR